MVFTVKIHGLKNLENKMRGVNRSIQTKMGIATSKSADILVSSLKERLFQMRGVDTFELYNSIGKRQTASYKWLVGENIASQQRKPHGMFVEFGFQRHWIHINMVDPRSKSFDFLSLIANRNGFVQVGPRSGRPWFSTGKNAAIPEIRELMRRTFREAVRG